MQRSRDPFINVGPGSYDPQAIEKHVNVPKLENKNGFTLPFNEKNPLNYVRPITVNIYFKQQNPGIGTYDPEKPASEKFGAQHVFKSLVQRTSGIDEKKLEISSEEPGPTSYDLDNKEEELERDRNMISSAFKAPMQRKIIPCNLYNPHGEVEEDKSKNFPGPG